MSDLVGDVVQSLDIHNLVKEPDTTGTIVATIEEEKLPEKILLNVEEIDLTDKRTAPKNGKLIHNWWVHFLKSFKYYINGCFENNLNNFSFNLGSKKIELDNLYENTNYKHPSCHVDLLDIKSSTNLNSQMLQNEVYSGFLPVVAYNETQQEELRIHLKETVINLSCTINVDDSTDVLNFYERLNLYPRNSNFMPYEYTSLINIHNETDHWLEEDKIHGVVLEAIPTGLVNRSGLNKNEDKIQRWGTYTLEPIFVLDNVSKVTEKQQELYQLKLDFTITLMIPQVLLLKERHIGTIDSIQIIMDVVENATNLDPEKADDKKYILSVLDKPITIDSDNVYDTSNLVNQIYLTKENFNLEEGYIELPKIAELFIKSNNCVLYNIHNTIHTEPEMDWLEIGYIFQVLDNTSEKPNSNSYYILTDETIRIYLYNDKYSNKYYKQKLEKLLLNIEKKGSWSDTRILIYD